jgi:hypothetical protein
MNNATCIKLMPDTQNRFRGECLDIPLIHNRLDTFMNTLDKMGFPSFEEKMKELIANTDTDILDFLKTGNGFVNFARPTNTWNNIDFYDFMGDKLFRTSDYFEVKAFYKNFMKTHDQKIELINSIVSGLPNKYSPDEVAKLTGTYIPLSDRGLCPDFSKLTDPNDIKYIVYGGNIENTKIKIKLTGIRDADEMLAFEKIGVPAAERNSDTFGFVLHHLDDFDPITGEATMQLVVKEYHNLKVWGTLFKHIGSVKLWEDFYLVKYK